MLSLPTIIGKIGQQQRRCCCLARRLSGKDSDLLGSKILNNLMASTRLFGAAAISSRVRSISSSSSSSGGGGGVLGRNVSAFYIPRCMTSSEVGSTSNDNLARSVSTIDGNINSNSNSNSNSSSGGRSGSPKDSIDVDAILKSASISEEDLAVAKALSYFDKDKLDPQILESARKYGIAFARQVESESLQERLSLEEFSGTLKGNACA